ncbi:MAG: hypothetical protein LC714_03525 [Actinobacteria bacterium]|nr:hypothetical protein [Actinomycetota bacterium]
MRDDRGRGYSWDGMIGKTVLWLGVGGIAALIVGVILLVVGVFVLVG